MTTSFRVYINESGDEGFTFVPNDRGGSRGLMLSALAARRENDLSARECARRL